MFLCKSVFVATGVANMVFMNLKYKISISCNDWFPMIAKVKGTLWFFIIFISQQIKMPNLIHFFSGGISDQQWDFFIPGAFLDNTNFRKIEKSQWMIQRPFKGYWVNDSKIYFFFFLHCWAHFVSFIDQINFFSIKAEKAKNATTIAQNTNL